VFISHGRQNIYYFDVGREGRRLLSPQWQIWHQERRQRRQ
jgi:hypothetical protein